LNSCYAYLLLCRDFSATCVVAEEEGFLGGFVSAYIPPLRPDVLFVWQVAVNKALRGKGLGKSLILDILRRKACRNVNFLETTVSPSNGPSQALFASVAEALQAPHALKPGFAPSLFEPPSHEEEMLHRIGPFSVHSAPTREVP
jgi:L-2,4-diaminobutyric acid acetyltransferase